MQINPYLMFNGQCEAAFRYYEQHMGGKIEMLMRYKEAPPQPEGAKMEGCGAMPAGIEELVMHAAIKIGDTLLMGSDSPPTMFQKPQGLSVTLSVDGTADAERIFAALSDGGEVRMPMGETFFAHRFGMVTDRFGIPWMVIRAKEQSVSKAA